MSVTKEMKDTDIIDDYYPNLWVKLCIHACSSQIIRSLAKMKNAYRLYHFDLRLDQTFTSPLEQMYQYR